MDWFILILNLFVTLYCVYRWKKSRDKEFLWLSFGGLAVVLLIIFSYFVNNVFNFTQEFTSIINTIVHYSWLLIFIVALTSVVKDIKKIKKN